MIYMFIYFLPFGCGWMPTYIYLPTYLYVFWKWKCTDKEIAEWFGIDANTLKYNFSDIITKGRIETKQALRRAQLKNALSGNTTMLIFLGKAILGQSDQPVPEDNENILPWNDDLKI